MPGMPETCLDCEQPARVTLVCEPCWQARLSIARDGSQAMQQLIRDAQARFPSHEIVPKNKKKQLGGKKGKTADVDALF